MHLGLTRWAVYFQWAGSTKMVYAGLLTGGMVLGIQYYPQPDTCYTLSLKGYQKARYVINEWVSIHY